MGRACSQSPLCGADTAASLALLLLLFFYYYIITIFIIIIIIINIRPWYFIPN